MRLDKETQFIRMYDPKLYEKGKERRKKSSPEHDLQVRCVWWFRMQYKKAMIFAIPNGGHRNVVVARRMKDEGVMKGVPDLCVPYPSRGFHGLYVEMKAGKKGKVSTEQEQVMDELSERGYRCAVCRDFDEFKAVVDRYMKAD